ncbi:MAG: hypothetical protein J7L43_00920 [Candidatus Aenigmarchaeota archaeon]|nr:hypothetical protein [Candidatus Aenigmarchaeota archaeon]
MTNLKVSIGAFIALIIATLGMLSGSLERFGIPVGDYFEDLRDKFSGIFEGEFQEGSLKIDLTGDIDSFKISPTGTINITIESKYSNLSINDIVFNVTNSSLRIVNFQGSLLYSNNTILLDGKFGSLKVGSISSTGIDKSLKVVSSIENVSIEDLRISSLSLKDVSGDLEAGNMSIKVSIENIRIGSLDGKVKISNKDEIIGTCSEIRVGNRLIK